MLARLMRLQSSFCDLDSAWQSKEALCTQRGGDPHALPIRDIVVSPVHMVSNHLSDLAAAQQTSAL